MSAEKDFSGPPLHAHHHTDEAVYVLEGEITVLLDGRTVGGGPGSFIQVPRGAVHSYRLAGDGPLRFLALAVPAGLEGYFEEAAALVEWDGFPPPAELLAGVNSKYDQEFVSPDA